jgi:hypothetical protein
MQRNERLIARMQLLVRKSYDTSARSHVMELQWIYSASFLPYTGEPIEFMLEERGQSIYGTFANGHFHSGGADYNSHQVTSWRESDVTSAAPIMKPAAVPARTFGSTVKQLIGAFSRSPLLSPCMTPSSRCTAAVAPERSSTPNVSISRPIDSNQMSS